MATAADTVRTINTVVVGGGQAGLAISRCLTDRGIDHIILEKGRMVERWRSERWESLRLLTPNWMTRLPGNYSYQGDDKDGFMTMEETIQFFQDYADSFHAPIVTNTEVIDVERNSDDQSLKVETNTSKVWIARNLVIATGFCDKTRIPAFADKLPPEILQVAPAEYKRPSQIPAGNVLIVGASATGCQIAEELIRYSEQLHQRNNESPYFPEITIAVGRHTRLPRRYRGRDILYWLYEIGFFGSACTMSEERQAPAPQIVGSVDHHDLDLGTLQERGVKLVGRAVDVREAEQGDQVLEFESDLSEQLSSADDKLGALLKKIDEYIEVHEPNAPPAPPLSPIPCPRAPLTEKKLTGSGVRTIIWATGYEREYPWLKKLPSLLNAENEIVQEQGVTPEKGVYVLGMRFQKTKISNFIDGVGADAEALADKIAASER